VPRLIVTEGAGRGLERCRQFLVRKDPAAAQRAAKAIDEQFALVAGNPGIGRPYESDADLGDPELDDPHLRELVIRFGAGGYGALYRYDLADDAVVVLAFRHQREAGYFNDLGAAGEQ
jgi:plasmid stabilization system protein ParE